MTGLAGRDKQCEASSLALVIDGVQSWTSAWAEEWFPRAISGVLNDDGSTVDRALE